ncbi:MAG: VanW family protein [Sporichthyaceae bacterium]
MSESTPQPGASSPDPAAAVAAADRAAMAVLRPVLRRAGVLLAVVVTGFAVLYGAAVALSAGEVPAGTRVLGVDIGGLSASAATARLTQTMPTLTPPQITITADGEQFARSTSDLGLGVDSAATAERAREGWATPVRAIGSLLGIGRDVEPVLAVDTRKLRPSLADIATAVRAPMTEGALSFAGGLVSAINPVPGRSMDTTAAEEAVTAAFLAGRGAVEASMREEIPQVSAEAVARALTDFGQRAVSAPVTITVAKDSVELAPKRFGSYLSTAPVDGALTLVVDTEGLLESLQEQLDTVGRPARDASFEIVDGKPKIKPSKPGIELDPGVVAAALKDTLLGTGLRIVDAGARSAEPEFSTADAQALNIKEKLGSFETFYPFAAYRVTNIGRAARLINGSVLEPGDIWSLNETVGERTVKNGFVRGFIIKAGKFIEDLGGGVSQSATTTYNAAFFAGLKDVEHHPHSLYIGRYPAGREATVAFGSKDLRFENDSGNGVYIQAEHRVGAIEVTMWGTKLYDEIRSVSSLRSNIVKPEEIESDDPECMTQLPVDGFDITVTRIFEKKGKEVKRDSSFTRYQPTDKITCVKKGEKGKGEKDKDKGKESPSPDPSTKPDEDPDGDPEREGDDDEPTSTPAPTASTGPRSDQD